MQQVRWAAIMPDGRLVRGDGAPAGLNSDVLPKAKASVLLIQGYKPIFIAGPISLEWLNDVVACAATGRELGRQRWWGICVEPPNKLWTWPDGRLIGIGPCVEDVERAVTELQRHLGLRLRGGV